MGKYSKANKPFRRKHTAPLIGVLSALVLIGGMLVLFRLTSPGRSGSNPTAAPASTAPPPTQPSVASASAPVATATGEKTDVGCKASYTVSAAQASSEQVVAAAGEKTLTNGALQILYLSQVNAYRNADREVAPDFSLPLDSQRCPLGDGELSWQQYFLQKAILSWQAQQAVLSAAAKPQVITEEAYKPNETDDLHGKYIAPELPVNDFLYQDTDCYTPNQMHQEYLDDLDATLDSLAKEAGFDGLEDMARAAGVDAQAFLQAARDYNTAYMFFTEKSYALDPTDEETADFLQAGSAALSPAEEEGRTVNIRHILILPQGAEIAADGKVTASDAQWEQALQKAQQLLSQWEQAARTRDPGSVFAEIANESSDDAGSSLNGGYYDRLRQGQLIAPLDEWCFADGRQQGDTVILRSELGVHLVYLAGFQESSQEKAREALLSQLEQEQWEVWLEAVPLSMDFSAVQLWADTTAVVVSLEDTLYPDIAHQRFPEAIVYLQQDYFYFPYGDREIGKNGCGITTFAMLATYMTDTLQTPPMMATRFDQYFDRATHGTNGNLFIQAPTELGFYLEKVSFDLEEVVQALQNGQMVISRQEPGHFTTSGHYLLIQGYNEEDDTFQVRDSNVFNYGRLAGHKTDWFTRANILSGGAHFYIMQKKITAIPACWRCGSAETQLLTQDYLCEKCTAALSRRNQFLSILDELSDGSL
ncbi:MAG: C39 family peptidase [Faecousia sp.]